MKVKALVAIAGVTLIASAMGGGSAHAAPARGGGATTQAIACDPYGNCWWQQTECDWYWTGWYWAYRCR
jgi:hypothetical protein